MIRQIGNNWTRHSLLRSEDLIQHLWWCHWGKGLPLWDSISIYTMRVLPGVHILMPWARPPRMSEPAWYELLLWVWQRQWSSGTLNVIFCCSWVRSDPVVPHGSHPFLGADLLLGSHCWIQLLLFLVSLNHSESVSFCDSRPMHHEPYEACTEQAHHSQDLVALLHHLTNIYWASIMC